MVSRKISRKLISLIKQKKGGKITRKEIFHLISGANIKKKKKLKGKRLASKGVGDASFLELQMQKMLEQLQILSILITEKNHFLVSGSLTLRGNIRPQRRGVLFVDSVHFSEVYIPERYSQGLCFNDFVEIELIHFYKDRWEGKINQIIKADSGKVFACFELDYLHLFIRDLKKQSLLAKVLDNPAIEYVSIEGDWRSILAETGMEIPGQGNAITEKKQGSWLYLILDIVRDSQNMPALDRDGYIRSQIYTVLDPQRQNIDTIRVATKHNLPLTYPKKNYLNDLSFKINDLPDLEIIRWLDSRSPWAHVARQDLRSLFAVTIDGDDAKDFDDAISFERQKGNFIIYVHIADVSLWLPVETDLDVEAYARGNSTYLHERVLPMLPPLLSERYCSLQAGQSRAVLTCRLVYDKSYNIISSDFFPAVIEVNYRLTYLNADAILDKQITKGLDVTDDEKSLLLEFLQNIHKLTKELKKRSLAQFRLEMELPELKIMEDPQKNSPDLGDYIMVKEPLKSYSLIEELMLAANKAAASLLKESSIPGLYRVHEKPDYEKIYKLQKDLQNFGLVWETTAEDPIQSMVQLLKTSKGHRLEKIINYMILRSLKQAHYTNDASLGHYGLAFADYLHFTSPIRRYPDLIVHRQIKQYLESKKSFYTSDMLENMGKHCSKTERVSMAAERDLDAMKICRIMQGFIGRHFQALITGVGRNCFYITLVTIPVEGRLLFENIKGDYMEYHESEYMVIGKKSQSKIKLGQLLEVTLAAADWHIIKVDFYHVLAA